MVEVARMQAASVNYTHINALLDMLQNEQLSRTILQNGEVIRYHGT